MGKYKRNPAPASEVFWRDYLDRELSKIAMAHNNHDCSDFPPGCVPLAGLATDQHYVVLRLFASSVGTGVSDAVQDLVVCPAGTLVSVQFVADAVAATASCDIHKNAGATIMSGDTTISAAETVYTGTVSSATIAADDKLELRCTTDGTGTLTKITAMLILKVDLV